MAGLVSFLEEPLDAFWRLAYGKEVVKTVQERQLSGEGKKSTPAKAVKRHGCRLHNTFAGLGKVIARRTTEEIGEVR